MEAVLNERLNLLLMDLLGEPENPDSEWVYYKCPFCQKQGKHKIKLAINANTLVWKCWVCKEHGSNLFSLIRKLGKWSLKDRVKSAVQNIIPQKFSKPKGKLSLPKEFLPLNQDRDFIMKKRVLRYLKKRGIGQYQINKYDIGFCQTGQYKNRIVIPSFDQKGVLNYFTGRSIVKEQELKYLNPNCARSQIIIFENLITWKFPVVLTEGIFDAMSVNFNAIPLMGKVVPNALVEKLLYYDAEVIITLDSDARDDQYDILRQLYKQGLSNIYYLNLPEKDPSEMGRQYYWEYLFNNYKKFSQSNNLDILKQKLGKLQK